MAETSEGWDGTVNEGGIARILDAAAQPRIESGGTISIVAGQRRVILGPIHTHHAFIRHENTDAVTFDLPAPAQGRWHLLVERRDWENNTVTNVVIPADTTSTDRNTLALPPRYPDEFKDQPGVLADMPLYWLWVRSTDNLVVTVSITRGRPYLAQSGRTRNENRGIVAANGDSRVLGLILPNPVAAGSVLHLHGQVELYLPAGNYGGMLRWKREINGVATSIAENRWHGHGRGERWLFPIVDDAIILGEDLPAGASFGLYVANDSLSSGGIEMWFPYASWFTY